MRSSSAVLLLLVAASWSHRAHAQQDQDLAATLFEAGVCYYNQGDYEKALEQFEEAYQLDPQPEMLFNIGQCHERLQDYDSAIQAYRSYLDASPGAEDRQAVQHKIEMLDEKMAKTGILLDVSVDGAVVYVDGVEVATSPVEGLLATSPGVHTLEVMREGYQPFTMKFTLPPGMSQQASVDLVPLPPPEPEPEPPEPEPLPSWFFWTYGIAGLAAAAAVATGVLALRKADQAARASEDHDRALWIARHDEMRRLSIATDVLIAAAAAAAVVSTVGLFVALDRRGRAREEPARAPSLSAWASPGAAGMSLTFGF